MKAAVRVENLAKEYQLGPDRQGSYRTLRESLMQAVSAPLRRFRRREPADRPNRFWALKDVTFDVQPEEVVGIIGRNGAGKSTLLKILSRTTEPTAGRIEYRGRVGSLLEVGTGFHPELSGRENIYLYGSILGMSRRDIARKFDEIVAFSEVDRFLDTPVKRYSSGLYARLAFGVAAHLEPDVLVVDEVLAVGDFTFQRKCLNKMNSISRAGSTVLFVSHNMATIQNLCSKVVVLEKGRASYIGPCAAGVQHYLKTTAALTTGEVDLSDHPNRTPGSTPVLRRLRLLNRGAVATNQFLCGEPITLELLVDRGKTLTQLDFHVRVDDAQGVRLFTVATTLAECGPLTLQGPHRVACLMDGVPLAPGTYSLTLTSGPPQTGVIDTIQPAATFEIIAADYYNCGRAPEASKGTFLVRSRWETSPISN